MRHPSLRLQCAKEENHEGAHELKLGPGIPDIRTEEFLRSKSPLFQGIWRKKLARGKATDDELRGLGALIDAFHRTEEP